MALQQKIRGRPKADINEAIELAIQNGLSERSTIDPHVVRKKLQPKSEDAYQRDMNLWRAYEKRWPGSTPCDMQTMKHFAEVVARTTNYRLDREKKMPTTFSVRNKMRRFYNQWERDTHINIPEDVKLSVAPYVNGELADRIGLSKKKRKPTFLTIENYVHMQELLWVNDSHEYTHEGSRVDSTNLLNTHCYTSARLQEVCQAKYSDIICMVSWKDGQPEFKMDFKREFAKGMQDTPKKPEHPFAERIEGPEGPPPLFAQPMLHWLANFLSSQAFRDFHTVEEILALKPPANESYWVLEWAEDKLETPIFPEWSAVGPKHKPKNDTAWGYQASNWAKRAGFVSGMGLHAARREALIKVDDNGYSMGQVMKFAAHRNPRTLVGHYLDDLTIVDGAACFLGFAPRRDLTEDFRSASMRRNPDIQYTLSAKALDTLRNRDDYTILTSQIESLTLQLATAITQETRELLQTQRLRLYKERATLERKELERHRQNQRRIYSTKDDKEERQGDWRRSYFDRIRHMMPERDRLSHTLCSRAPARSKEWISALRDLIALRTGDCRVAYQDVLRPIEGRCPVPTCRREVEGIIVTKRWKHAFCCFRDYLTEQFEFAEFCFLCSRWLTSSKDWEVHCRDHIDNQDVPFRCDPVTFRHAVACAGYCLACLGNLSLPATQRLRQFLDRGSWLRHISHCIPECVQDQKADGSIQCLHLSCRAILPAERDLWYHLNDVHSVPKLSTLDGREHSTEMGEKGIKPLHGTGEWPQSRVKARVKTRRSGPLQHSMESDKSKFIHISSEGFHLTQISRTRKLTSRSESICDSQYGNSVEDDRHSCPNTVRSSTTDGASPSAPASTIDAMSECLCRDSSLDAITTDFPEGIPSTESTSETAQLCDINVLSIQSSSTNLHDQGLARTFPSPASTGFIDPRLQNGLSDCQPNIPSDNLISSNCIESPLAASSFGRVESVKTSSVPLDMAQQPSPIDAEEGIWAVETLLAKWKKGRNTWYLVKWQGFKDQDNTWQKPADISPEIVNAFEKNYRGNHLGVELKNRRRVYGRTEYLVRWTGRPKKEDSWLKETEISRERIAEFEKRQSSLHGKEGIRRARKTRARTRRSGGS